MNTAIFVLSFAWRVARGLNNSKASLAAVLSYLSNTKKHEIEYVIPEKQVQVRDEKTVDFMEYLKERKRKQYRQEVELTAMPEQQKTTLFLN